MTGTPWGDSADLREQKLPPGPGRAPGEVAENQRRRLLGAMVASVATRGYADTGVADLAEIAGVSPRSFYQHFESKARCFQATLQAVLELMVGRVLDPPRRGDWKQEARDRLESFASFAADQPAAARMVLVEAYAAGGESAALVDEAIRRLEDVVSERLDQAGLPASMPRELVVAAVATAIAGTRNRLLKGQLRRLPEFADQLASFLLEFEPPLRPLRVAARAPERRDEEREAGDHAERAIRAFEALMAEGSLTEITMGKVAKRAGMSVRTLYANFAGREELMLAAVDSAAMQAVAVTLPAYRRGANPSEGVMAAFSALYGMLASRPNLAHLLLTGIREGGAAALARRAEALRPIEPLLAAGVPAHRRPVAVQVASEALLEAVLGLAARRLGEGGAGALPGLVPISSFMVLSPVLGPEAATAAAEGRTYRKPAPAAPVETLLRLTGRTAEERLIAALVLRPGSAAELAELSLLAEEEVEVQLRNLQANGLFELEEQSEPGEAPRYQPIWSQLDTEVAGGLAQAEREAFSAEVGTVIKAEVEEAVAAGTFDARPDRYLARLPVWLDEQGWAELLEQLDDSLAKSVEIQRRALERLRAAGDPDGGSFGRVLFVSFEVPRLESGES